MRVLRRIRNARERAKRGFSREDCWSFDYYLAEVIASGCAELRHRGHGYPACLRNMEEWDAILEKIERGFAAYEPESSPEYDEAMALFVKWFPHLWD